MSEDHDLLDKFSGSLEVIFKKKKKKCSRSQINGGALFFFLAVVEMRLQILGS